MDNDILKNVWPEWKILRLIGRGSYGSVYEAERSDSSIKTRSAIKIISVPHDESEIDALRSEGMTEAGTRAYFKGMVDDFVGEISLMESFRGIQNIVSVEDYKVVEKTEGIGWDIYIRMELLIPFNTFIQRNEIDEQTLIKLGIDISTAIELCGKNNIIHRDIKPDNIFVNTFGDFKLGDFGIARRLESAASNLSQKGTYQYMAPEIQSGARYDKTVDIYSLGLVLYKLANKNRLPFMDTEKEVFTANDKVIATRRRFSGESIPAPCGVSADFAKIILKACEFEPRNRFQDAGQMKKALKGLLYNEMPQSDVDDINEDNIDKTVMVRRSYKTFDNNDLERAEKNIPHSNMPVNNDQDQIPPKNKKNNSNNKTVLIIVIIIAAALLVAAAIIFMPNFLKKDESNDETTVVSESTSAIESTAENETTQEITETTPGAEQDTTTETTTSLFGNVNVGDIITFGTYEQDNNLSNGQEAIQWYVLRTNGKYILLLSVYGLDCQIFDSSTSVTTWENSYLRNWLNTTFLNTAFSAEESARVLSTNVTASRNAKYPEAPAGNDTTDKVFLLSIDEATQYITSNEIRKMTPTAYALAQGAAYTTDVANVGDPEGYYWWLRTSGGQSASTNQYDRIALVYGDGTIDYKGTPYSDNETAVRPAIWINIE